MGGAESEGIPVSVRIDPEALAATIATTKPSGNHVALGRALAYRRPALSSRVACPAEKFARDDGGVDESLARIANSVSDRIQA